MDDIAPVRLGDKYILLDLLGTGGMAEVYRGKLVGDRGFEKLIVIKQLPEHVAKDPEQVAHFTSEARLAALLQHENIATVYDFGVADGRCYMAMEYLFGKDLHSVIKAGIGSSSFRPEYALMICLKICEAMGYAHSLTGLQGEPLKIIHRDLTPHNIFITYDGKVKIIDFGIAKTEMHDNKTRVGVIKGKITYMSPEQLAGDELDFRSDIFAIGILLYEMLSGKRMYTGDTAALIRKAITVDYKRLEQVISGLDPLIYQILDKTLMVDPSDRYQSCEEMQVDIERCFIKMSTRDDYRLLKTFMHNLFTHDLEAERERGLQALGAAKEFEAESTPDTEKTMFLSPGVNSREKPSSSVPKREAAGFTIDSRVLLAIVILLCTVWAIFFIFFYDKGEPTKETVVAEQQTVDRSAENEPKDSVTVQQLNKKEVGEQRRQRVDQLVKQAEDALAIDNLTAPADKNAFDYYKEIEKIDPGHHRVQEGFRRISERYAELAEQEITNRKYGRAIVLVERGIAVYPESGRLAALQGRLTNERSMLIADLSRRAEEKILENMLTTPTDDCALKYYNEIAAIDADNVIVQEGYRKIGNRYALLADSAFERLDFDQARHFVSEGLSVDPDNHRLQILEQQLLKSTPEMIMKGMEKKLKSIF